MLRTIHCSCRQHKTIRSKYTTTTTTTTRAEGEQQQMKKPFFIVVVQKSNLFLSPLRLWRVFVALFVVVDRTRRDVWNNDQLFFFFYFFSFFYILLFPSSSKKQQQQQQQQGAIRSAVSTHTQTQIQVVRRRRT